MKLAGVFLIGLAPALGWLGAGSIGQAEPQSPPEPAGQAEPSQSEPGQSEPGQAELEPSGERPPDVLLLLLDDVNDWVGYLGGRAGVSTPSIDAFAARARAFTNGHCSAPVCNPSRTSMLSGLRPRANASMRKLWMEWVEPEQLVSKHFQANGYRTVAVGKVMHGNTQVAFEESYPGQDSFDGAQDKSEKKQKEKAKAKAKRKGEELEEDNEKYNGPSTGIGNDLAFDWAAIDADESQWRDYERATRASEILAEDGDQPLFLAVGFSLPHLPWYVPKTYFDLHPLDSIQLPELRDDDLDDLPRTALALIQDDLVHDQIVEADKWREAIQAYLAGTSFIDAQVGRVLAALEQSPRRDRTIVVLASDHGWHLGEKGHWRKATLWERSTRIPFVISGPGIAPGNCTRPVELLSVYSTLCELAGLDTPEHVRGPSLVPLLEDPAAEWPHLALTTLYGNHTVRGERYRLIRYETGALELYDLDRDPGEFNNLVNDINLIDTRHSMKAELERMTSKRR